MYSLRFKAIPDYDKDRGQYGPYPFDNFAILCIRRHLSTLLKSSFQNKRKVLNTSVSLDQDRKDSFGGVLFLSDILPRTDGTLLESLGEEEYYGGLFNNLFGKLSKFEKRVFILYIKKYSYEQIKRIINKNYKKNDIKKKVNVKSIDNGLSRVKQKAREIFENYLKKEKN